MATLDALEDSLAGVFKNAPKIPDKGRAAIVEWAPWISLVVGLLSLLSVYTLWHWAHVANNLVDYANQLSHSLGLDTAKVQRLTFNVWLALLVMAIQAVMYLMAYPGLKARKKSGWNLVFYASLVNVVYAIVVVFTAYGGVGNLIGSLIGTAIGLWILFQIRPAYR